MLKVLCLVSILVSSSVFAKNKMSLDLLFKARGLEAKEFIKKLDSSSDEKQLGGQCDYEREFFFVHFTDASALKSIINKSKEAGISTYKLLNSDGKKLTDISLTFDTKSSKLIIVSAIELPKGWSFSVSTGANLFYVKSPNCSHTFQFDNFLYPKSKKLKKK